MRIKQLWHYVPLPAKIKLVYNRLTLSHVTTAYFILTLLHCIVQISLQSRALDIERTESLTLQSIISAGNVTERFASLDSTDRIELCHAIPGESSDHKPCQTYSGKHGSNGLNALSGSHGDGDRQPNHKSKQEGHNAKRDEFTRLSQLTTREPTFKFAGRVDANGQVEGVNVIGLDDLPTVSLSATCTEVFAWPDQIVSQAKLEALAMIAFQVWLFGISIVAILNESIPHVVAALATHILSTAWASFQIPRTEHFEQRFAHIVTDGACDGVNLMPEYWRIKISNQIPILVLNGVSLLVSAFLSWKLFKQFGVQSFNRVGASPRMHRIYLLVLILSASLQLSAFFLVASLALWIEQLSNGPIAPLAKHSSIYLGVFIATAVLILPWLFMGWVAVRRERRRMMLAFLLASLLLIAAQTAMFISPIYRLTFGTWTFFAALTVAAYTLLVATFAMAIVCRALFGRGLAHFLQVQDALDECDFTPVYFDKGTDEGVEGGDEKGSMPWDEDLEVRKISVLRDVEDSSGRSVPSAVIRVPPRAHSDDGEGSEMGGKVKVRFMDQDYPVRNPVTVPPTSTEQDPFTTVPTFSSSPDPPMFDSRAPTPGHKRESSSGTWYNHPGGRDFIQRGVNVLSPVMRGFNITNPGKLVVGLPASVRPPRRRPPGLNLEATKRALKGMDGFGRI